MRLAHFSDLHVLWLNDVPIHRFWNKRLSGYANLFLRRRTIHRTEYIESIAREIERLQIDHIAITGDITNLALEDEFERARNLLERELHLPPSHVSLVPGNHDLYTRGSIESKRFHAYFSEYTTDDRKNLASEPFPFVRLCDPIALIGLSSATARPPLVASGKVGDLQLQALRVLLQDPEVKRRTPVLLIHHPPHSPSALRKWLAGLEDGDRFLASIDTLDRGLILHGHLHKRSRRMHMTSQGHLWIVGATSASLDHTHTAKMAGFNLYEFSKDGSLLQMQAHVFDPSSNRFRQEPIPFVADYK